MANQIRYQVGFDIQQNNLNQLKASLQQLQKMKISDIMKINNTDITSATAALTQIKEQVSTVEAALKQAFNVKLNTVNIETFNQSLKQSHTSIEQIYQTFKAAGATGESAFRSLSSSVLSTNLQLKESHGLLDKMAETLSNTVKWNIASSVVNGLTRSVEQAWGYVKSLDSSLNDIRVVTGKSADEMANFAVQANEAAQSLGKTTTDYTNAALIYAQQGLSDQQIEARTAITLKTASVTGQSADAVSEQLTAVWNGYKVSADEAELYVDRLAAVAATTASDLQELSTGMSKVASAAAAMGVGEDQLAAQLSTIISVTRQAPESVGTALRTIYARISDIKAGIDEDGVTLGRYSSKMAELGFNVLDMSGNLRDMGEVMEEIGGKWDTLTREQQVYLAQTMAGQRQYNNLLALFDNFAEYNKTLNVAQNAMGTLQEQQDIYMDRTTAHLNQLKAATEDVYDSLIDTSDANNLIDVLTKLANLTADFIDGIGGGAALLRSLGAIGITVFSQQIAKGLNTSITNFEIGADNARQFDEALQATRDWQGIPELDETSKQLLQNREQLLELSRLMTPEQFSGMQTLLNNIISLGNEVQGIQSKIEPLQNLLKRFTNIPLKDVLGDGDQIDKIIAKIQNPIDDFDKLNASILETKESFRALSIAAESAPKETKADQLGQVFDDAQVKIKVFLDKINELRNTDAFKGLSEDARGEFDKIDEQWEELLNNFKNMDGEQTTEALKSFFDRLSQIASSGSDQIKREYDSLVGALQKPDDILALEEKQRQAQQLVNKFISGQERMQRAANIESYAKVAGGIAQIGASIQQVQNIGSIWQNEDLTDGQKFVQIVTNLATSLPMLVNGITKTTTAFGLLKTITTEEAVAAGISTSAQAAHAVSIGVVGKASGAAAIKVQLLNKTLLINPFVAVAAGVLALVAALRALAAAHEKAQKAAAQARKEEIESINVKQEEIDKNKELYKSLQDLNQQYEEHEISRVELKSAVEGLIQQYGLEGEAAEKLRKNYLNLKGTIDSLQESQANEGLQSAQREKALAEQNLRSAMQKNNESDNNGQYEISFAGQDFNEKSRNILKNAGVIFDSTGNLATFSTDESLGDIQGFIDLYDKLSAAQQQLLMQGEAGADYYAQITEWLNTMKESAQQYKAAVEDVNKYSLELKSITDEQGFGNISSLDEYTEKRTQLIKTIEDTLDVKDATATADAYLREYFSDIYNQYDDLSSYVENLKAQMGDTKDFEQIEASIENLDEEHLALLMGLGTEDFSNWETYRKTLIDISKIDLSNAIHANVLNGDMREAQTAAADNYTLYQSMEDQVSGGKTISSKQLERLAPQVQQYFTMLANGQYKMTGDAKQFYELVNSLKLSGFQDQIDALNAKIAALQQIGDGVNQGKFNFDQISESAATKTDIIGSDTIGVELPDQFIIDQDIIDKQLNYLEILAQINPELQTQVDLWRNMEQISEPVAQQIADTIVKYGDYTADWNEQLKESVQLTEEAKRALADAGRDSDLDISEIHDLSEYIQQLADQSEDLADTLSEDTIAADDVAQAIMRFDDAAKDVTDNYDDWIAALQSGAIQDQVQVIDDLRDTYADLLNLDGSSLSQQFLLDADNLKLMQDAVNGVEGAYDQLLEKAGQDIIAHLNLSPEDYANFQADLNNVQSLMDDINFQDIEIGAQLNDGPFLDALSNMVNAAGMTAQQATDYLASMGVDAEVTEHTTTATEQKQVTGYHGEENNTQIPYDFVYMDGSELKHYTGSINTPGVNYVPDEQSITDTKENSAFSLKVQSAHKASGGGFKYSHSSHGGGSSGGSGKKGGSSGGSSGKKGGSSGSSSSGSSKAPKSRIEDQRDIFHDINIELKQLNRQFEKLQKRNQKLYGRGLILNLQKQLDLLEQQKKKLKEKQKIQQKDLEIQRKQLEELNVEFDDQGNISNYMSVVGKQQKKVNKAIDKYNQILQKIDEAETEQEKKKLQKQLEKQEEKVKKAEEKLDNLQDKIKEYDASQDNLQDIIGEIEDNAQKQIEIKIKKFRMDLQIRLDMGQARRDWNEFRRNVLEHTDILKDSDFSKILKDARQNYRDLQSYFFISGHESAGGSIQSLTEKLKKTRKEIEKIDEKGKSSIYGDDKAQAMQDLQNDLSELMNQMQDMQDLIDSIGEAYLDTIDDIADQFDEQIENYEFVGDLIQHDMDLLTLLYGEQNYKAMDSYYTTLQKNQNVQMDSLRRQQDFWKQQWEEALENGDIQAAKKFEENYKQAISQLNSTIEQAAQTLQNKYTNAVDRIFSELNKKFGSGLGLDYMSEQWEFMNKNANQYLDTINAAYAIQDLQGKFTDALNGTKSIKGQRQLKRLMDQQLQNLRSRDKLTQYEVQRAQKLLQIEQARIAMQQAQANKTNLRLRRDSQGNYSYEYTADEDAINEAEKNLSAAQNELYNFDKQRYNTNLDQMLSAWKDFQQAYKEILLDINLSDEERQKRLQLLTESYTKYINQKTDENSIIRENLLDSASISFEDLFDGQSFNETILSKMVPGWNSGVQEMINSFAGPDGLLKVCQSAFQQLQVQTKNYQSSLKTLAKNGGFDLNELKAGIDDTASSLSRMIESNSDLIKAMNKELNSITKIKEQAEALAETYKQISEQAEKAAKKTQEFIQKQQEDALWEPVMLKMQQTQQAQEKIIMATNQAAQAQQTAADAATKAANAYQAAAAAIAQFFNKNNPIQLKESSGYTPFFNKSMEAFASGGYTGSWSSQTGKVAMLHQKQLVLNEADTKNILSSVKIMRSVINSLDSNILLKLQGLTPSNKYIAKENEKLEQDVYIQASFPAVDSKREIEQALNDLVNLAAQRALR